MEVYQLLHSLELQDKYEFWTFERLGYQNERIIKINSIEDFPADLDPLHLVILFKKVEQIIQSKDLPLFGIDDSVFLQNPDCPGLMTKREVRVQLLAELNLPRQGIIWDIGSGVLSEELFKFPKMTIVKEL